RPVDGWIITGKTKAKAAFYSSSLSITNYFLPTPKANITQPAIKATPPIGVTAPSQVILVTDKVYKDPEKISIPNKKLQTLALSSLWSCPLATRTPTSKIARVW